MNPFIEIRVATAQCFGEVNLRPVAAVLTRESGNCGVGGDVGLNFDQLSIAGTDFDGKRMGRHLSRLITLIAVSGGKTKGQQPKYRALSPTVLAGQYDQLAYFRRRTKRAEL